MMADDADDMVILGRDRSRSIQMPSEMPTQKDLVAFHHAAAGHEGISSNGDGSLVIKPCTQAEIDFYEFSAQHEDFLVHLPTFVGSLTLNQDQNATAPLLPLQDVQAPHNPSLLSTLAAALPIPTAWSPAVAAPGSLPSPLSAKRTSWKPSGGKKLDTGLAIVLENIAAGFTHPNILDIKLGARLWADDAPASKRRKLDDVSRETTSGSLGFRIAGMKLWSGAGKLTDKESQNKSIEYKDGFVCYTKQYGRDFNAHDIPEAFLTFVGGLNTTTHPPSFKRKRAKLILKRALREMKSIQSVLENQESRMYSASVLLVHEGSEGALETALEAERETPVKSDEEDDNEEGSDEDMPAPPKVQDARLIDFAHAAWTPGLGPDENVLQGIRSVVKILQDLVALGG